MKEDCYLRKDVKEDLANKESGWVTKMRSLLDSYGMSSLILNMLKVLNGEIDKREYKKKKKKITISFSKKQLRTVASKLSFTLIKMKRTTFFHKQKKSLKRKDI